MSQEILNHLLAFLFISHLKFRNEVVKNIFKENEVL